MKVIKWTNKNGTIVDEDTVTNREYLKYCKSATHDALTTLETLYATLYANLEQPFQKNGEPTEAFEMYKTIGRVLAELYGYEFANRETWRKA